VSGRWTAERIPPIGANAHKGERRRLVIVGGGVGMAGAAILAARAATRSGIGIVRLFLAKENVAIAQTAAPEALARAWPDSDDEAEGAINNWAHGLVLGPGLGNSDATRALAERVLRVWRGPVVVDADALNVFEGDAPALGKLLRGREALITPHASECARLVGMSTEEVLASRFEVGAKLARKVGGTVLLKGVPTIVSNIDGRRLVSASGSPVLGAAGSGDVLAGIAGTLVTQRGEAFESAAVAAWIHGRAGEIAARRSSVRGTALEDVLHALSRAWRIDRRPERDPVLATLPRIRTDSSR
jgi:NAD(P)H-hydrate epimerase